MRHGLGDIIQGLKCIYEDKMKLRKASEELRGKGVIISHDGLRRWKQKIPDFLRVLISHIEPKPGDKDALSSVESIRKNIPWLNLNQTDKKVKVLFYSPKQVEKQTKKTKRQKIIEKHEKDGRVRWDIKKPMSIEFDKKDRLGGRVFMASLSGSDEFTDDELAGMFDMDSRIVEKDINRFKELGAKGLIDPRGRKKPWKRTPEITGEVIFQLFSAVAENKLLDNSLIANDVNMALKDMPKPIAGSMVKNIKKEINFTGMKSRIPGISDIKKTAGKRNP